MTDKLEALKASARGIARLLGDIASFDSWDIDGDIVDIRFEDENGCDTGADVSITETADKASQAIGELLAALEEKDQEIARLLELVDKYTDYGTQQRLRAEAAEQRLQQPIKLPDFGKLTKEIVGNLVDCAAADDDVVAQYEEFVYKSCRAAMLQPVSQGYTLPKGYKLVPVEPTPEMIAATEIDGDEYYFETDKAAETWMANKFKAMLAAAPTPTKAVSEYSIAKYEELFGEACQAARYPVKHENESVPSLLRRNTEKQEHISELLASIPPIKLPELMEIAEDATRETRHLIRSRNYLIESIAWLLRYQGLKVEGFPDEIPGKEKS